jgi:predicted nucleic acid-binding protein
MSRIALDSNILIYNHSLDCENKMLIALDFFNKNPIVSSQVISQCDEKKIQNGKK